METRTNKGAVLTAMALVAALIVAAPLMAQENQDQPAANGSLPTDITLRALQAGVASGGMSAGKMNVMSGHSACIPPTLTCGECMFLDSYNPNNTYNEAVPGSVVVNTVTTSKPLTAGEPYLLTISGTVSYWAVSAWTATTIGHPESSPTFLSLAVPTGAQQDVGFDWEYLFAYPNSTMGNFLSGGPIHFVYQGISLNNGATFNDLTPLGGQVYNPQHTYRYLVVGTGQNAQVAVADGGPHSDNYGMFKVCFQHLTPCPLSN